MRETTDVWLAAPLFLSYGCDAGTMAARMFPVMGKLRESQKYQPWKILGDEVFEPLNLPCNSLHMDLSLNVYK